MSETIVDVTHAMQAASSPVFLILGAGTLLGAMSIRYGRVLDRARLLIAGPEVRLAELAALRRRAQLLRRTIILNVASVYAVALTILVMFATMLLDLRMPYVAPGLFSLSLILLLASLTCFIEDVAISLRALDAAISARSSQPGVDLKVAGDEISG